VVNALVTNSYPQWWAQLLLDARCLGGSRFAREARDDAVAAAAEIPAARDSVAVGTLWQLVDAQRARRVGETLATPDGKWRTVTPARCPRGHPLDRPGHVLVGWMPCRGCSGHRSWRCLALGADGTECGAEVLAPEPADGCAPVGIG
jgi:hypothetical protein